MDVKRKKYFEITESTTSNEILALLDTVDCEEEENIECLLNELDTEFVAEDVKI